MPQVKEDRSLGELFRDLSQEVFRLLRHEVAYAKTEMAEKVSRAEKDLVFLAIGIGIAFAGFLFVLAAVTVSLAKVMPLWGAALLVGVVVGVLGVILLQIGIRRLKQEDLAPKETVKIIKEESQWLKKQMT